MIKEIDTNNHPLILQMICYELTCSTNSNEETPIEALLGTNGKGNQNRETTSSVRSHEKRNTHLSNELQQEILAGAGGLSPEHPRRRRGIAPGRDGSDLLQATERHPLPRGLGSAREALRRGGHQRCGITVITLGEREREDEGVETNRGRALECHLLTLEEGEVQGLVGGEGVDDPVGGEAGGGEGRRHCQTPRTFERLRGRTAKILLRWLRA
jgi:hypothetical protein